MSWEEELHEVDSLRRLIYKQLPKLRKEGIKVKVVFDDEEIPNCAIIYQYLEGLGWNPTQVIIKTDKGYKLFLNAGTYYIEG